VLAVDVKVHAPQEFKTKQQERETSFASKSVGAEKTVSWGGIEKMVNSTLVYDDFLRIAR
jgi:hypothetical protein